MKKKTTTIIVSAIFIFLIALIVPLFNPSVLFPYIKSLLPPPARPTSIDSVVISLERTECFGTCPSYIVTIYGDGRVEYEGREYVKVTGKQTGQISSEDVKMLVDKFYEIRFFSFNNKYRIDWKGMSITDRPTQTTSIAFGDYNKKVIDYYGAPDSLRELEDMIDAVGGTDKWVTVPPGYFRR